MGIKAYFFDMADGVEAGGDAAECREAVAEFAARSDERCREENKLMMGRTMELDVGGCLTRPGL
jgi:hypothetical protein